MNASSAAGQISPPPSTELLMSLVGFTSLDLAANRDGKLSQKQRARLRPPRIGGLALLVLLAHVALILALLGGIALLTGRWELLVVALLVAGLAGLPVVLANNEAFVRPLLAKDLSAGRVAAACGPLARQMQTGRATRYYVIVEGVRVEVPRRAFGMFREGVDYCLYYLPESRTLLSVEVA